MKFNAVLLLQKTIIRLLQAGFAVYMAILMWELFFSAYGYGRAHYGVASYNLHPFQTIRSLVFSRNRYNFDIWFFNLFGNVIAFMPLGFLLPIVWRKAGTLAGAVLVSFFASLLAEVLQLTFRVGSFDVDDLILNTLGGALGFMLFALVRGIWRLLAKKAG